MAAAAPICALPKCGKPCSYSRQKGEYRRYCSEDHFNQAQRIASVAAAALPLSLTCACEGCGKVRHVERDRVFAYCGRGCGRADGRGLVPETLDVVREKYLRDLAAQGTRIDFYKEGTNPLDPMSLTAFLGNFHECRLQMGGFSYPCSESLYQAFKYIKKDEPMSSRHNQEVLRLYTLATDGAAWRQGQQQGPAQQVRPDWLEVNEAIMENIVRLKYAQNPNLRTALLATGNARLNERTDRDSFWGDGADGKGQNKLGLLHEKLRKEMQDNGGNLKRAPASLEEIDPSRKVPQATPAAAPAAPAAAGGCIVS